MSEGTSETRRTEFNPGSREAIERGCICPVMDNHNGAGANGDYSTYWINVGCPLHGLKPETKLIHAREKWEGVE